MFTGKSEPLDDSGFESPVLGYSGWMTDDVTSGIGSDRQNPAALETRTLATDGRRFSPSIGRNKDAVRDVFLAHMPVQGSVLEIASGTGEHGAHITRTAMSLSWQYSDIDEEGQCSQNAWVAHFEDERLRKSLLLNTCDADWGEAEAAAPYDGIFCANMVHIAPFEAAIGLFKGAGRVLSPEGRLMLYGPFSRNGDIAPSNQQFSEHLKSVDSRWAVRDLDREIVPLATENGLVIDTIADMPANNTSVIFKRG